MIHYVIRYSEFATRPRARARAGGAPHRTTKMKKLVPLGLVGAHSHH